jgi:hypothetical protein
MKFRWWLLIAALIVIVLTIFIHFLPTPVKVQPTPKSTWTIQSLEDCYGNDDECGEVLRTRQLGGDHQLRKLMPERTTTTQQTSISGGFFFFVGGLNGSTTTSSEITVTFAWQMADGAYAIDTVPLSKIRIRLDDKATAPSARFRWTTPTAFTGGGARFTATWYDNLIEEVTFTCRPEDWPVSITMPLSGN